MCYETVVPADCVGLSTVKGRRRIQQLFGIWFRWRRRKADDTACQYCDWTPLARSGRCLDCLGRFREFVSGVALHRNHKAVAASGDGLDAASPIAAMIENAAKRQDLDREVAVRDHDARPDGSHDLGLRNEPAMPSDEHGEHVKRARPDRHRNKSTVLVGAKQTTAPPIETKPLEFENPAADCLHADPAAPKR